VIPYGRQDIDQNDIESVLAVLTSDFLTQGPVVPRFEQALAEYCQVPHAVAVNSATSALHLACLALGLAPGDSLWTSPNSFVASANCALYCGANIDFVDIDPRTYNLCADALEAKLITAEGSGTLPKIVIPVHFAGQSCEMERISKLAQKYGFAIIEDASHAIGGSYHSSPIGQCNHADITVFSFHPVKIITTAEGGVATTRRADLAEKMQLLRSHGITRDPKRMTHEPDGEWYYQQVDLGFNYRMTELQAALGCSQLERLDTFVTTRHALAKRYDTELADLPLILPWQHPDSDSAYHLYPILIDPERAPLTRTALFSQLRKQGIGVNVHYIPIHTQPWYYALGFVPEDFPNALAYYQRTLSLPLFYRLSSAQQTTVITTLHELLS
jgi:UDP-4-amino-4,6-dideoxy-N-acetyl-beta-L-altrosamine transaminase